MDKFRYMYSSNLMLDECERCGGIWVQDGELRRMREILEAEGVSKAGSPVSASVSSAKAAEARPSEGYVSRIRRVHQFIMGVGRA
jgi:Zn-finger nucleic acid-binding protein